ncbi:TetR/AcrR family transcriptional regulator [Methanobrevibacter sp. UBA188]|jgi:AcrR family transcriptional regulator|uniref:TetR/AcrR family transcriptional regulator n=2 Tax=Methanobrevibacter TaxID=2172 RepID=UPI001D68BAE2|nr:TetR/AcrR family transcriptional regulator [Methanobrevibacter sp. UBA188]MBE6491664.1 TetR/AcrR family transcriptional regulator [Methanobrevibacter sp.]
MNIQTESTEDKIISATFRLIRKDGIDKVTTKKIAAEAGVNEVTIFRKFNNKQNLVDITKDHYMELFLNKMEEIFSFDEDISIEQYLKDNFFGLLNLSDEEFSVLKVAMEEGGEISDRKRLISQINDVILDNIEEFFKLQIQKGEIKDINPRALSIMCFGVTFQSIVLWKVYNKTPSVETEQYFQEYLNIIFNGIKE